MIQLSITLPGAVRTKKNHSILITKPFPRLIPGKPYRDWFDGVMEFGRMIRDQLVADGVKLPLAGPIEVRALVYRDRRTGDLLGYLESIGDTLQAEAYSKPEPGKKRKKIRDGLGIIVNDGQIMSWDGSRLLHDKDNPRVELTITTMDDTVLAVQDALDLGEPEPEQETVDTF
jgi:hypothetical protein